MARITPATKHPPVLEFASWKTAAYQTRYQNGAGENIPGVTGAVNNLDKSKFLVPWANNLGLEGHDSRKYVDEASLVGTLAHYFIECEIKQMSPEEKIGDFSRNQIEKAAHAVQPWRDWCAQFRSFETVESEFPLISEEYQYGGTIDHLVLINGALSLVDYKSSSGIYRDHRVQVSAYWRLLKENGYDIRGVQIVKVPRSANEIVKPEPMSGESVLTGWRIFWHLLQIHREIKGNREFK